MLKVVHFYFFVTCLLVILSFVDVPTTIANSVFFFLPWNPYACLESSSQRLGSFSLLLSVFVLFAESLVSIYIKWNIPFYQDDPPRWDKKFMFRRMFPWDGIEIVLYKFYNRFYKMATTKKKQPEKLRKIHLKIFLPEKNTVFKS